MSMQQNPYNNSNATDAMQNVTFKKENKLLLTKITLTPSYPFYKGNFLISKEYLDCYVQWIHN